MDIKKALSKLIRLPVIIFMSRPEIALHKRMCNERICKKNPEGLQFILKASSSLGS
jgi:hypothetical protein